MNTKYGLRGAISPGERFKTAEEAVVFDGFEVEVKDGSIAIGFNDPADADRARTVVGQHLAWFSLTHGIRYTADLNQSWEVKADKTKAVAISVFDTLKVTADVRVTTVTIQGKARIVTAAFDSAKMATYSVLVEKSQESPALAKALEYFSDEVVDDDRPVYGIYKAIEALTQEVTPAGHKIDEGRKTLGELAGYTKKYVDDIMQSADPTRHHKPTGRRVLTDDECRDRARQLIESFAKSI